MTHGGAEGDALGLLAGGRRGEDGPDIRGAEAIVNELGNDGVAGVPQDGLDFAQARPLE